MNLVIKGSVRNAVLLGKAVRVASFFADNHKAVGCRKCAFAHFFDSTGNTDTLRIAVYDIIRRNFGNGISVNGSRNRYVGFCTVIACNNSVSVAFCVSKLIGNRDQRCSGQIFSELVCCRGNNRGARLFRRKLSVLVNLDRLGIRRFKLQSRNRRRILAVGRNSIAKRLTASDCQNNLLWHSQTCERIGNMNFSIVNHGMLIRKTSGSVHKAVY